MRRDTTQGQSYSTSRIRHGREFGSRTNRSRDGLCDHNPDRNRWPRPRVKTALHKGCGPRIRK